MPRPTKIPVAIVDDNPQVRVASKYILECSEELRCVGSFSSGESALAGLGLVKARVVLMDIRMPEMSGIECARRLRVILPWLAIVFVSGHLDASILSEAYEAGGEEFLTKPFTAAQCLISILVALRRKTVEVPSAERLAGLTERETAVIECLAKGLLDKEIADELRISFWSVRKHLRNIFPKLHVGNRTEAAREWRGPKDI